MSRAWILIGMCVVAVAFSPRFSESSDFPTEIRATDGAIMVFVPGGRYTIGADDGSADHQPAHTVDVQPFYIDRTEVTNAQYLGFCQKTGHRFPPLLKGGKIPKGAENLPVVNVDYRDADEYAIWAKKTLPTEEQWEAAARGTMGRIFPYGEIARSGCAAIRLKKTVAAGKTPCDVSPFGVMDMGGNVMEWTSGWWRAYSGSPKLFDYSGHKRVVRGASFSSKNAAESKAFIRRPFAPDYRSANLGFRCVRAMGR